MIMCMNYANIGILVLSIILVLLIGEEMNSAKSYA